MSDSLRIELCFILSHVHCTPNTVTGTQRRTTWGRQTCDQITVWYVECWDRGCKAPLGPQEEDLLWRRWGLGALSASRKKAVQAEGKGIVTCLIWGLLRLSRLEHVKCKGQNDSFCKPSSRGPGVYQTLSSDSTGGSTGHVSRLKAL